MNTPACKEVKIILSLPPMALKAQQGTHPAVKQSATKKYRAEAHIEALSIMKKLKLEPFSKPVIIDHTWLCSRNNFEKAMGADCPKKYRTYKPRDAGNAITALKAAIDGIVDSGLIKDDRAAFLKWGEFTPLTKHEDTNGRCGVILTIREVQADA